jgi:hypothetical protein
MAEFLRKWLLGIGSAWALVGGSALYVFAGGPLPSTSKVKFKEQPTDPQYLEHKEQRRLKNLENLASVDEGLDELLQERARKRQHWKSVRQSVSA